MLRLLLTLAGGASVLYLCAVALLFVAQRALIFPAPKGAVSLPAGFEEVVYRTDDGLRIKGAYRRAAAGMPTAVFFHGNADSWSGGAIATSALAEAGYGILLAGYRGYADNPGRPGEAGLYRDGRAALGWLAALGIDRDRLVIIGNSVGSGIAVQMADEAGAAALVLVSPLSSLPDVAAEKFPWLPVRPLLRDRFDNLAKIAQVKVPILILHGRDDAVIPPHHAERLASMAPHARLILFDGIGHELAYLDPAKTATLDWLRSVGG